MSTSSKLGVAVVGAGWVAKEYVRAFHADPRSRVVGALSRTAGRAGELLRRHGVDGREYRDLRELLDDDRVQIVVSATPPDARPEHVIAAARSGRHLVVEKPIALTSTQVRDIRRAVADAGVKSVTSFVLRWHPQLLATKKLYDDGALGEVIYAEADYWHGLERGEGSAYDWRVGRAFGNSAFVGGGCHAVDILRFITGLEIVEVAALGAPARVNPDFGYDPVVVASARFANGAVGKVSAVVETSSPYRFTTRLHGTKGTVIDGEVSLLSDGEKAFRPLGTPSPSSGDVAHHPFAAEVAELLDCVESGVDSPSSVEGTWRSMEVCFAIDESAAQGGAPVRVRLDADGGILR